MITLDIDEEYGFRRWKAILTEEEYQALLVRWSTMRGLNCLVSVKMIIPQAVQISEEERLPDALRCHIHECDDSHLAGSNYVIPDDDLFWLEGKSYTDQEIFSTRDSS